VKKGNPKQPLLDFRKEAFSFIIIVKKNPRSSKFAILISVKALKKPLRGFKPITQPPLFLA
jgi:hypothetical protein